MGVLTPRQIKQMTVGERLELIDDLCKSIETDKNDIPLTPNQEIELDRRLGALEADRLHATSWTEVKAKLDARIRH
jgi:putative addiction module component (TIGR02574 family)